MKVLRRFRIRNADGGHLGEGVETESGEVVARLPFQVDGAPIGGEGSRWEDLDVALSVTQALGLNFEWIQAAMSIPWEWECVTEPSNDPQPGTDRSDAPHLRTRLDMAREPEAVALRRRHEPYAHPVDERDRGANVFPAMVVFQLFCVPETKPTLVDPAEPCIARFNLPQSEIERGIQILLVKRLIETATGNRYALTERGRQATLSRESLGGALTFYFL